MLGASRPKPAILFFLFFAEAKSEMKERINYIVRLPVN
jgi:hypothetical protein